MHTNPVKTYGNGRYALRRQTDIGAYVLILYISVTDNEQ